MFREGGLDGLYELASVSATRMSDAARKSPGSVISAIQYRVAMEDGVLVPWKKTRPEDTKSAWDLLKSDRGGLYLDSQPGVYANVIELDFASLFPSIIATRNISPETLNCAVANRLRTMRLYRFTLIKPKRDSKCKGIAGSQQALRFLNGIQVHSKCQN